MKRLKYFILLLVLSVPTVLLADQQYDRIYVFGDSLSDTGNLASIMGDFPQPPYYQNRVTNGLVAVEVLANRLGLPLQTSLHLIGPASGTNYAVAAAQAVRSEPIDLGTQVALFLANHGGVAPSNALYVMFLGGNDVRSVRGMDDAVAQQVVNEAANTIAIQMQVLSASGAKNWLVVGSPDVGLIPETHLIAAAIGQADLPQRVTALSIQFNTALKHQMQRLEEEEENLEVTRFDLLKLFGRIVQKHD